MSQLDRPKTYSPPEKAPWRDKIATYCFGVAIGFIALGVYWQGRVWFTPPPPAPPAAAPTSPAAPAAEPPKPAPGAESTVPPPSENPASGR